MADRLLPSQIMAKAFRLQALRLARQSRNYRMYCIQRRGMGAHTKTMFVRFYYQEDFAAQEKTLKEVARMAMRKLICPQPGEGENP